MLDPVLVVKVETESYRLNETIPLASVISPAGLQLTSSRGSVVENAGTIPDAIQLRLESALSQDLQVRLRVQPEGLVRMADTVTIKAGELIGSLALQVLDNSEFDSDRSVLITAEATGFHQQSIRLGVIDDDTPEFQIQLPERVGEGDSIEGTLRLSHVLKEPLKIRLSVEGPISWEKVTFVEQKELLLPAGEDAIRFTIHALVDSVFGPINAAAVVASSPVTPTARKNLVVEDRTTMNLTSLVSGSPGNTARTLYVSAGAQLTEDTVIELNATPPGLFQSLGPVRLSAFNSSVGVPLDLTSAAIGSETVRFDLSIQLPGQPAVLRSLTIPPVWPSRFDVTLANSPRAAGIPIPFAVQTFDDQGNLMLFGLDAMTVDLVDNDGFALPVVNVATDRLTPKVAAKEARIRVRLGLSVGFSERFDISAAPSPRTLPFPSTSLSYHRQSKRLFSGVPPSASAERNSVLGIDPGTGEILSRAPLSSELSLDPYGVQMSPDGTLALVLCNNRRQLSLIEVESGKPRWIVDADHGTLNPSEYFASILQVNSSPWQCIVTRYGTSPQSSYIPLDTDRVDITGAKTVPGLKIWSPMPAVDGAFLATGISASGLFGSALRIHLSPDGTAQVEDVPASVYLEPFETYLPHLFPLAGEQMLTGTGTLRSARTGQLLRRFGSFGFPIFENEGATACFMTSDDDIQRVTLRCFDMNSGVPLVRFHFTPEAHEVVNATVCESGTYAWSSSQFTHLVTLPVDSIPAATSELSFNVEPVDPPIRVGTPSKIRLTFSNHGSTSLTNVTLNLTFNNLQIVTPEPGARVLPGNKVVFGKVLSKLAAGASASWILTIEAHASGRASIVGEVTSAFGMGVRVLPIHQVIEVLPNPNEPRIATWSLENPSAVAWDSLRQRLYTVREGDVISLDPFTGAIDILGRTGDSFVNFVNLDPESRYLYVTTSALKIHRMDLTGKEAPFEFRLPPDWREILKLVPLRGQAGSFICSLIPTRFEGDASYSEFLIYDGDKPRPRRARILDSVGRPFQCVQSSDLQTVAVIGLTQDRILPLGVREDGVVLLSPLDIQSNPQKFPPFRVSAEWYDLETLRRLPGAAIPGSLSVWDAALGRLVQVDARNTKTLMLRVSDEGGRDEIGSVELPAPVLDGFGQVNAFALGRGVAGAVWRTKFFVIRDPLLGDTGQVDLSADFVSPPARANFGEEVEFRFKIRNSGNARATNVVAYISNATTVAEIRRNIGVTDRLPVDSNLLRLGTMAPEESLEVVFRTQFPHPGSYRPYVILSSSNADPNRENNIAITSFQANPPDWIQSQREIQAIPSAMAYRKRDGYLYVSELTGLLQMDPKSGQLRGRSSKAWSASRLVFSEDEQDLFAIDATSGKLFRRRLESGVESEWLTSPGGPLGMVCTLEPVPGQPGVLIVMGTDPETGSFKTILVRADGSVAPQTLPYAASVAFSNDLATGVLSTSGCGGFFCASDLRRFRLTHDGLALLDASSSTGGCGRLMDVGNGRFFQSGTVYNWETLQPERILTSAFAEHGPTDWDPYLRRIWSLEGGRWSGGTQWALQEYDVHTGLSRHTLQLPGVEVPIQVLAVGDRDVVIAARDRLQFLRLNAVQTPEAALQFEPPTGTLNLTNANVLRSRIMNRGSVPARDVRVGFTLPNTMWIDGIYSDIGSAQEDLGAFGHGLWVIPELPPGSTATLLLHITPSSLMEGRMPVLISGVNLADQALEIVLSVSDNLQGDSDKDGLPDAWEFANGLNSGDPVDATQDDDGDGATNRDEYVAGTDPHNPMDSFLAEVAFGVDGVISVVCDSKAGKRYGLQFRAPDSSMWIDIGDPKAGTGASLVFHMTVREDQEGGFLRLVVQ